MSKSSLRRKKGLKKLHLEHARWDKALQVIQTSLSNSVPGIKQHITTLVLHQAWICSHHRPFVLFSIWWGAIKPAEVSPVLHSNITIVPWQLWHMSVEYLINFGFWFWQIKYSCNSIFSFAKIQESKFWKCQHFWFNCIFIVEAAKVLW
jgi:hypothetical protein